MKVTLADVLEYASVHHIDCNSDIFDIISKYISEVGKPKSNENKLNAIRGTKSQPSFTDVRENLFGDKIEYSTQDVLDLFST